MIRLTPSEQQILQHFSAGKSVYEIAAIMKLTNLTLQFYIRNLQIKCGCKSQEELIAKIKTQEITL